MMMIIIIIVASRQDRAWSIVWVRRVWASSG